MKHTRYFLCLAWLAVSCGLSPNEKFDSVQIVSQSPADGETFDDTALVRIVYSFDVNTSSDIVLVGLTFSCGGFGSLVILDTVASSTTQDTLRFRYGDLSYRCTSEDSGIDGVDFYRNRLRIEKKEGGEDVDTAPFEYYVRSTTVF